MDLKPFFLLVIFLKKEKLCNAKWPPSDSSREVTNYLQNKLALEVFKYKRGSNQVVSPLAMKFPLCKLAEISVGEARRELMSALGLQKDSMAQFCYKEMKQSLSIVRESDLLLLNKIFVNTDYKINSTFKANLSETYGVQLDQVGFKYPKAALRYINGWFDSLSYKRLQDVVSPHEVTKYSSMIIANAAHFKGTWEMQFDLKKSKMGKFYHLNQSVSMIPMMHKQDSFLYIETDGFKVITFYLLNWGCTMTFVVPDMILNIDRLLAKLEMDPDFIRNAKRNSKYTFVKVQMPRFKIKTATDFNIHLQSIGIKKIFDATDSGLNNMLVRNSSENIYLSKAKQKLFIDVDEFGVFRAHKRLTDEIEEKLGIGILGNVPEGEGVHYRDMKMDKPFYFTVNVLGGESGSQGPDGQGRGGGAPLVSTSELFVGIFYGPE